MLACGDACQTTGGWCTVKLCVLRNRCKDVLDVLVQASLEGGRCISWLMLTVQQVQLQLVVLVVVTRTHIPGLTESRGCRARTLPARGLLWQGRSGERLEQVPSRHVVHMAVRASSAAMGAWHAGVCMQVAPVVQGQCTAGVGTGWWVAVWYVKHHDQPPHSEHVQVAVHS